jgi:hypothetical protein
MQNIGTDKEIHYHILKVKTMKDENQIPKNYILLEDLQFEVY